MAIAIFTGPLHRTTTKFELLNCMVWNIILKNTPSIFIVHVLPSGLPVVMLPPLFVYDDLRGFRVELTFGRDPVFRTVIAAWSDVDALI